MRQGSLRLAVLVIALAATGLLGGMDLPALAEDAKAPAPVTPAPAPAPATAPAPAAGGGEVKQMLLTDKHVEGFIAAQKDLAAIASKIQAAGDKPDAALQKDLDDIAKKNGFAGFGELDDVASNISIVMAGLDPQTGSFVDPVEALKKELEDVKADASIPDADKKQLTEELSEAIKTTQPLKFKENVDVVKKHREDIEKAVPGAQ